MTRRASWSIGLLACVVALVVGASLAWRIDSRAGAQADTRADSRGAAADGASDVERNTIEPSAERDDQLARGTAVAAVESADRRAVQGVPLGRVRLLDTSGRLLASESNVVAVDSTGQRSAFDVAGSFDLAGTAPFLVALETEGFAPATYLVLSEGTVELEVRAAATVSAELLDERGHGLADREVFLLSTESSAALSLEPVMRGNDLSRAFSKMQHLAADVRGVLSAKSNPSRRTRALERLLKQLTARGDVGPGTARIDLAMHAQRLETAWDGRSAAIQVAAGDSYVWCLDAEGYTSLAPGGTTHAHLAESGAAIASDSFAIEPGAHLVLRATVPAMPRFFGEIDVSGFERIDEAWIMLRNLDEEREWDLGVGPAAGLIQDALLAVDPQQAPLVAFQSPALPPGRYSLRINIIQSGVLLRTDARAFELVGAHDQDLGTLGRDLDECRFRIDLVRPDGAHVDLATHFAPEDEFSLTLGELLRQDEFPERWFELHEVPVSGAMRFQGLPTSIDVAIVDVYPTLGLVEGLHFFGTERPQSVRIVDGAEIPLRIVVSAMGAVRVRVESSGEEAMALSLRLESEAAGPIAWLDPEGYEWEPAFAYLLGCDVAPVGTLRVRGRVGVEHMTADESELHSEVGWIVDQLVTVERELGSTIDVELREGAVLAGVLTPSAQSALMSDGRLMLRPRDPLEVPWGISAALSEPHADGSKRFEISGLWPYTEYVFEPFGTTAVTGATGTIVEVRIDGER